MLDWLFAAWVGLKALENDLNRDKKPEEEIKDTRRRFHTGRSIKNLNTDALAAAMDQFPKMPELSDYAASSLKLWMLWWFAEAQKETATRYEILFNRMTKHLEAAPDSPFKNELKELLDELSGYGRGYTELLDKAQGAATTERVND